MNAYSELFINVGLNLIEGNSTEIGSGFHMFSIVDMIIILFGFPTNSYVIWLIANGAGNGLAAECFSLSAAVCEILICLESAFALLGYKFEILWIAVYFFDGLTISGRPLFQSVICVERYLAVVHPVTFLRYKPLRYRLICSAIIWAAAFLLCIVSFSTLIFLPQLYLVFFIAQFLVFLSIQLFCLVAILRTLKQSGPGDRQKGREEKNLTKKKALYLILITNMTMAMFYTPYIILLLPQWLTDHLYDPFSSAGYACFTLFSLVQPFAFFYRVGKLSFMRYR